MAQCFEEQVLSKSILSTDIRPLTHLNIFIIPASDGLVFSSGLPESMSTTLKGIPSPPPTKNNPYKQDGIFKCKPRHSAFFLSFNHFCLNDSLYILLLSEKKQKQYFSFIITSDQLICLLSVILTDITVSWAKFSLSLSFLLFVLTVRQYFLFDLPFLPKAALASIAKLLFLYDSYS